MSSSGDRLPVVPVPTLPAIIEEVVRLTRPVPRRQADRWHGHDGALCAAATHEDFCSCEPWECRDCGQRYNDEVGHDCPAVGRFGPNDWRE